MSARLLVICRVPLHLSRASVARDRSVCLSVRERISRTTMSRASVARDRSADARPRRQVQRGRPA